MTPDLVGQKIGEYEIVRPLGQGGMGAVYEGRQPLIGKRVAIKLLLEGFSTQPQMVERFLAEARAVNAIGHRGIVDIFGFGRLNGDTGPHYCVMEYLEGQDFEALIRDHAPFTPREALGWVAEILDALEAAHRAGVLHRDLKPSNLFLVHNGTGKSFVKLLDFGVAKLSSAQGDVIATEASAVVGTPFYMAPEQVQVSTLSGRTDLYALGCVLFELLTGRRVFEGTSVMKVMNAHVTQPPRAPSALVRAIPPAVDALVARLLAKKPADRPRSAAAARDEVRAVLRGLGDPAHRPGDSTAAGEAPTQLAPAHQPRSASAPTREAEQDDDETAEIAARPNSFGRYTLGEKLAQGGMAEIFAASLRVGADLSKQLIIKRILPSYASDERFVQMFAAEARIAMGLSHGNIAQVFDFGQIDGAWFLAMERVDGRSLAQVLKAARARGVSPLPAHLAVIVVADTLKALHYAHTRNDEQGEPLGIVHRDVSPQNVLVSFEGQVKLVDFGIARARNAATEKTEAGVIKGKFLYFSPEQILEQPLDGRSDVFACGSMLYQLLTGQLPFKGEAHDVMRAIVHGRLTPPRELEPSIPPALEEIVLKALATSVDQRYPSAAEFERALLGWLHAAAPTASNALLAQLVSVLFATELELEGRKVEPTAAFLLQFEGWKRELPEEAPQAAPETRAESSGRKSGKQRAASGASPALTQRRSRVWVPLGAAALVALGWAAAFALRPAPALFELQVTSIPPGASVTVDGVLSSGSTPLTVKDLASEAPHRVQVGLVGMRPWEMEARGAAGSLTRMHAELQRLPAEQPDPPPAPAPTPAPIALPTVPKGPQFVTQVHFPADEKIELLPKGHVLSIPQSKAARAELDPKKTYKLWLQGEVSFGGRLADIFVDDCHYLLEGPGVQAHEAFGVLGHQPVRVSGAARLYAFISDTSTVRHSGAFRLQYQAVGDRAVRTLLVDAVSHNVMPEGGDRLTVAGLNYLNHYTLTLRDGAVPARTLKLGKPGRVLMGQEAGLVHTDVKAADRRPQRLLETGKTYEVTGADRVWFWFPDVDAGDNEGSIEVVVDRVDGSKQPRR
jgi:eukaryotic-like serine/threonine-protein kinase